MTVAPLVADGIVITGISGGEFGIRGFIDGWDPKTGDISGAPIRSRDLASLATKPGRATHGSMAAHPLGHRLVRSGAAYSLLGHRQREFVQCGSWLGDNLYASSMLALDPKTGKIKWHYQFSPNDPFDYDAIGEPVLATIKVGGTPTKVLLQANKNGFFYVLDRTNGKLLAANPFVKVNWASAIDMKTGRPVETELTKKARSGELVTIWPSAFGGKNWEPMSFNPQTETVYANTLNIGWNYKAVPAEYKAGEFYWGVDLSTGWAWPDGPRGYLKAIDPLTGTTKWESPSDIPRFSGVLSTAGGLVFSGQLTGEFEAFDAETGKKLWQFQTGSGVEGQPITWEQDGVQYVAIASGYGGVYSLFSGDPRLASIPAGGSLWVFALSP